MRTHIVMVPGFGGFDALGQIHYYTGVTDHFADWRRRRGRDASLHYFDNLPTAAVATRAKKLARFLGQLADRQIVQAGDELVLLGHSTGGLDIRQLVRNFADAEHRLLGNIRRLVFMSVPQLGTNIADWMRAHQRSAHVLVSAFRRAVGLPLAPVERLIAPVDRVLVPVERRLLACVAPGDHPDLVDAVEDARRDMQPNSEDPLADADARSARSEIELWMSNVDHDFFAIDDLSVVPPAHPAKRVIDSPQIDAALWREHEIATQSYATLGRPLDPTRAVARELASLLAVVRAARTNVPGTDVVYRVAHTACASGPFAAHALEVPWLPGCGKVDAYAPQPWENDGIVNTASATRSPDGGPCFLVPGDHGDIIGHFDEYGRRSDTRPDSQRERDAYDLLGSDPPGTFRHAFAAVWDSAFDFAVPR